ncbi:MAG: hypothetical protein QOH89_3584 [Pseudonocardiales bacterium]|nr:hypothetical protein [Pseudonocardiales bacterium]
MTFGASGTARRRSTRRAWGAGSAGLVAVLAVAPAPAATASAPAPAAPADGADQSAGLRGHLVAPAVEPNFGTRKIRVGVQIKDGSVVPAGTDTGNTLVRIQETGPNAEPFDGVSQCSTEPGSEQPNSTETFCQFQVILGGQPFTSDGYAAGPGDTVTITQLSVEPNLRIDRVSQTFGPCVTTPHPDYPLCPEADNDFVTDHATFNDPAANALYTEMWFYDPIDYWVLDNAAAPAPNEVPLAPAVKPTGAGPAASWKTPHNPPTGEPGSVQLHASARRSGQYLRSGLAPARDSHGTVVIWFRVPKALPTWRQVIAVDNGAWSGTGGGLMIDPAGHLISADASGYVDYRTKRTVVNDARWHCAVWADTYSQESADPNDWTGSSLYLDGNLLTDSSTALWSQLLSVGGSRLLLGDAGPQETRTMGRFTGNLSNVAIYDSVLNPGAVRSIWEVGIDAQTT